MSRQLNARRRVAALVALLAVALGQAPWAASKEPVPIIFDTDMGNDVDDALALALLHALQSRGECRLLAVTVSKDNRLAAAFVDAVNRFYGRGEIPVGLVRDGATKDTGKFLPLAEEPDGRELRFPHRFSDGSVPPPAVYVLRKTLALQADDSVVIVQVGFSTNLARLLDSAPDDISPLTGRKLVKQKVRLLSVMGGWFSPDLLTHEPPSAEYNIVEDVAAAQHLARDWPTPIVWSGFEVGRAIEYPAASIDNDFGYVAHHPIAEAYRLYNPPPHNRPTWDLTSALYAVRPSRGYFDVGPPGRVTISDDGRTAFTPADDGPHRLLTVTADQVIRAREAFVNFCSEPPPSSRND